MVTLQEQKTYELWLSSDGSYDFFLSTNESARALLNRSAELITTIEADTWELARQKQFTFLGWGRYQPAPNAIEKDIFITDSEGRKTTFRIDDLFSKTNAYHLTKANWKQLRWLEEEKIVVPEYHLQNRKRDKFYTFPQLLQLQAYVLIDKDKNVSIRPNVLKKVLRFYSSNFRNINRHQSFPYSVGSTVKSVEHDLTDSSDFLFQVKQLDFSHRNSYTVHIYPSLVNVIVALHESVQSKYNVGFDEFRLMLVA